MNTPQTSTSSLSLFFFFISISISIFISISLHFKTQTSRTLNPNHTLNSSRPQTNRHNYIVRFVEYKRAEEHRDYLKLSVRSDGWDWIERNNPAKKYPTDFGLVWIEESAKEMLISEIGRLGMVKDVNVDVMYGRGLLTEEKKERIGAFVDGKKRPGKILTAMSFSEADSDTYYTATSNSSISWRRQLLNQRSQVTSLFGADFLWAKGYTGAKVKMAIFDTGIRANHPHFRNIKERTNWTNEDTLNDNLGHGTFVAGVIAGVDEECLGFAPDTEIYAFRVFTDAQVMASDVGRILNMTL